MASYIRHYGIKDQKWGVRRFQNEDGTYTQAGLERYFGTTRHNRTGTADEERVKKYGYDWENDDYTVKKGSSFTRYSTQAHETDTSRRKYVTGGNVVDDYFGKALHGMGNKDVYELRYEVQKDLKIAGKKTVNDALNDLMKDKTFEQKYYEAIEDRWGLRREDLEGMRMDRIHEEFYGAFGSGDSERLRTNGESAVNILFGKLKEKGFSGVSDMHGELTGMGGANIIFGEDGNLKETYSRMIAPEPPRKVSRWGGR